MQRGIRVIHGRRVWIQLSCKFQKTDENSKKMLFNTQLLTYCHAACFYNNVTIMIEFKDILVKSAKFSVVAELTPGPGYNVSPIVRFLEDCHSAGSESLPESYELAGIAVPQNPGGVANLDPSDVLAHLTGHDLLRGLNFMPHLTCKDHNQDALWSSLVGYRQRGIKTVLALTGDTPVSAKGVFQNDSISLLQMVAKLNRQVMLKTPSKSLDTAFQFFSGAAVSPFKYTEASLILQYYRMEKKLRAGAGFLITQVGWDWRKSFELMTWLKDHQLDVPVLGNVYLLTTTNPAARLMHSGKLPGCYVSDQLYEKLKTETFEQHLDRAAQQVAMYQAIGAAGVDIGGVHDFQTLRRILEKAASIGDQWSEFQDNLYFPPKRPYYLYDEQGKRLHTTPHKKTLYHRWFNAMHSTLLDPKYAGFHALKKTMTVLGAEKRPEGRAAKSFTLTESLFKHTAFQCQDCGDCYLPENFGYCTLGGCKKGLANAPCGDTTVHGTCGNNIDRVCRGEQIYRAAAASPGGLAQLRKTINAPRNPELAHTSSILNYIFARDHTMKNALISIGEAVHASIPKTGRVMKDMMGMGESAFTQESGPLKYMRALIEDQAAESADYIAVNVDAFGEIDPQLAVDQMVEYVKLVRQWGHGVPICIDSSDNQVLIAGLKAWYDTDSPVKPPLVNAIKIHTSDTMMALKKAYDFAFVGLLVSEDQPTGPGGSHSVAELVSLAEQLFDKAVGQYGFKPQEIFFDSTVFPLAIDIPALPDVLGYTYRAFETIRRIKSTPRMKDVHFSLGISNCCRDLPGRKIGICRAYVAKAMTYGLDAGIVNVHHHFGQTPADPSLLELVTAYAEMDGAPEKTDRAITLMGDFCRDNRKSPVESK